jgi:hypothetical protein
MVAEIGAELMAFPFLKLLPSVLRTIAKITGLPLGDAATALEGAKITPEQQLALQESLERHEQAMKALSIDEMKTAMSESLAMIASPDKYVSRARPTGLYIFYGVSGGIAAAMIFGVHIDATAILTILGPLAGVSGTYVYQRTQEKLGRNGNSE